MTDERSTPPGEGPTDDTHPIFGTPREHTAPLPAAGPPTGQPTGHPYAAPVLPPAPPAPVPVPPRRGRKGFAAGVIAASLLVGGGAGLGGAAAWDAIDDDEAGTGSSTGRTTSQVVDREDAPAAEGTVEAVATAVLPSVVKIDVRGAEGAGSGSGIVLSSDGQILTNEHVVELAGEEGAISVSFSDGSRAPAEILGTDPLTDVAVIQAEGVDDLTAATLGSSDDLKVGEGVVAIGSPFGLDATVTSGIVSALGRPVGVGSDGQGNTTAYPAIQTDAAINPGNSGGALTDMAGRVVGINSSIQTTGSSSPFGGTEEGGSIGLGFAIPIDDAMPIVEEILAGEEPTHARLGITVSDAGASTASVQPRDPEEGTVPEEGSDAVTEGAEVQEIGDGSAAGDAGLEPGDVITHIDDQLIAGSDDLVATIRSFRPGDTVTVTYQRDGEERTTELELDSDADRS